jgi:hypothetical protein
MKSKKSKFIFKGKDLGIGKLKILEIARDDIEDYDIEYSIVGNSGSEVERTDWVGEALELISFWKNWTKEECVECDAPWHIKIVKADTFNEITEARFKRLFGDALLLEHRAKQN